MIGVNNSLVKFQFGAGGMEIKDRYLQSMNELIIFPVILETLEQSLIQYSFISIYEKDSMMGQHTQ